MRVDIGKNRQLTTLPRRGVFDRAGDRLGDIQQCDDGFIARDRQGREIGTFTTLDAATVVVWRIACGQEVS
jgi:hypothetical protein